MTTGRRALLITLATMVAAPLAGALFQTVSVWREASRFPPPGRLIAVDGTRRLHLVCLGEGEPTVIFESSGLGGALSSALAREEVSAHTRVCSYDRMGMGWSDPGPDVISGGLLADDLERLITQAGLRPPIILVPASIGGLTAELFTRRHPDQVAGLVFVDAANSALQDHVAAQINWMSVQSVCLVKAAARFGFLRIFDPLGLRKRPSEATSQAISRLYRVEPMSTFCGLARGYQTTAQELATAPPLPADMPLIVLVHDKPEGLMPPGLSRYGQAIQRDWLTLQQRFAQRSRRGTWRIVPGSDHLIGNSQPHAVATAVLEMLAQVRRPQ